MSDNGEPGRALLLDCLLSEADIRDNLRRILHEGLVALKSDGLLRWEPFLSALVDAYSMLGSLAACGVTPGQKCVSLQFVGGDNGRHFSAVILACLEEPLRLLASRFLLTAGRTFSRNKPNSSTERFVGNAEVLLRLGGILNTLVFLVEGRYPTMWLRLLGLRQTPVARETFHTEDFTGLGREALWHTFKEFLSIVLPFGQLMKAYLSAHVVRRLLTSKTANERDCSQQRRCDVCALCGESPPVLCVVFVKSNCADGFCYSCVKGEPLLNGGFVCPCCKSTVRLDCAVFNCSGLPLP